MRPSDLSFKSDELTGLANKTWRERINGMASHPLGFSPNFRKITDNGLFAGEC
jgi:hypothetical protein